MKSKTKTTITLILITIYLTTIITNIPSTTFGITPSLKATIETEHPFYSPGELVKLSGNITDQFETPIQGATVAIEVKDPSLNTIFLDITNSYSNGSFYDIFRLPLEAPPGEYTVYCVASKIGYNSGSNQTSFSVGSSTGIAFAVWTEKATYMRFENATVYGKLLYNCTAVEGATITFQINFPNNTLWLSISNITTSTGITTQHFYLPPTIPAGQYTINATSYKEGIANGTATAVFMILNQEPTIHTATIYPQITEKPDTITIEANVSDYENGKNLTVICIITFPNSIIQILNMSLTDSTFKIQYQILETHQPGTYSVTIRAIDQDAGSTDYQTTFKVISAINKGSAEGYIITNSGQGIANAKVTLSLKTAYLKYSTTTDAHGKYNFTKVMVGEYYIIASSEEYATQTLEIQIVTDQTTRQNITLPHLPIIKGIVTTQDGIPIPNASVKVLSDQAQIAQGLTIENGSYQLTVPSQGTFTVIASAAGYSSNSTLITCNLDQTTYANFSLIKNGILICQIINALSGEHVVNATVIVSNMHFTESQKTNLTGYVTYDISPGNYSLIATASNFLSNGTTVTIYSNQTTTLQIQLLPTGNITGYVIEASQNSPVELALVSLIDYRGVTLTAVLTDSQGCFLFYSVKPGNYTLKTLAYGYNVSIKTVTIEPLSTITVNFTLVPNQIFLTLETSSNQYSRGETIDFTITVTDAQGHSIADNVTAINLVMKNLNNETREVNCSRKEDHFEASYYISNNETTGIWTVTLSVTDIFENYAESIKIINICEAFLIQFFTNKPSYVEYEKVNFTAYVVRYSNLTRFLNSTEITAYVDVRDKLNITVASINLTTSGNIFTGELPASNLSKGIYTAYLTVTDFHGNIGIASTRFSIVQDFEITINTNKDFYNRTEAVYIYGIVTFTNGTPATSVPIILTIVTRNYPRSFYVNTNNTGFFEYIFNPLGIDAGNYTAACYSEIEGIKRVATKNFTILGLAISPTVFRISMSENSANNFSIKILNIGEVSLTGVNVTIQPSIINGVTVSILEYPQSIISPGGWTTLTFRVSAAEGAAAHTAFNLTVKCNEKAVEFGRIEIDLYPATPVLQVTPQLIDVTLAPDIYSTHTITLKNIGYKSLLNATITNPSNSWIFITKYELGNLAPQETKLFDVIILPPNSTEIGLYQDKVTITSENHSPVNIYIIVKITTAQNGTLLVKVVDDVGSLVSNARVTIQYQEYWLQAETKITNSTGYCEFPSLPGGRYSYHVSAEDHQTVSGTVTVKPGSTVYVEVIAPLKIMEVSFEVIPITIEDEYYIVLNMTFETEIPPPILVPIPPILTFTGERMAIYNNGYEATSSFSIYNTGLISVFNISIFVDIPLPTGYTISFGDFGETIHLDEIAAKGVIQVPCKLIIDPNTIITELEYGVVGKIQIEGYYVYFDQNQNPEIAKLNAEVLVRIIDKGIRRLCVNPPAIYGVNLGGVISFTPGAWPERLDDVMITNCAENESVYISTIAVGGGLTIFMGLDLYQIITSPVPAPLDLGGFVAFGLITKYGGLPGQGIRLVDAEETFGMVDVEVFGGPLMSLLVQALVRHALEEGTTEQIELQPAESAILSSEKWDIPFSWADLFEQLIGFRIRYGVEITIGGIVFAYQWELDTKTSFHLVPIFIVDFYTPYIAIPVSVGPVSEGAVPWSSWWSYSEGIISPPSVTYISQPTIPTVQSPPNETIHEVVKLSISQEATLERDAFLAILQMTNKMSGTLIENVHATLEITFVNGTDAKDNFYVKIATLEGISNVDGNGSIQPGFTATVSWIIIPKPGAGGVNELGTYYNIQAKIVYTVNQTVFDIASSVETINVKPQPLLILDYYLPSEVVGNNPFKLAVKVTNIGHGTAHNFQIESAQPIIYDNQAHLMISFALIGSYIQGEPVSPSLKVSFGDVKPGESIIAYWIMITTLSGTFTEFTATFTHSNVLGGAETSLIQTVNTHLLIRDISVNETNLSFLIDSSGDTIPDQLVDPASGVYTSVIPSAYNITYQSQTTIVIQTQKIENSWIWIPVVDPFNNQKEIIQIRRSDGKILNEQNYWMEKGKIYIVDDPDETYIINFYSALLTDIVITNITFSHSNPSVNQTIQIYVTVENRGNTSVTFDLSVNYTRIFDPLIGTQTITLEPGEIITINFTWIPNVAGLYEIKAYTSDIPDDNTPENNTLITYLCVTTLYTASTFSSDMEWT